MKTKFQKLVVSLLVAIMFLTSNGTLALAVEINEIVDANSVATVEDVVEENVATEDLTQVVTEEEVPEVESEVLNEEPLEVSEEVNSVEEDNTIETVNETNVVDVKEETIENNTTSIDVEINSIEEVKAEEVKLDSETRTFTGSANSVNVRVVAQPGTFPEGTTMVVTSVESKDVENAVDAIMNDQVNDMKAVDISFYANGKEVEPKQNVNVELTTSAFKAEKDLNVVHIQDNGKIEKMDLTNASKTTAEFKAESFSVYVVVETGEDARLFVEFKTSEDGDENNKTDIIKTLYVKQKDLSHIDSVLYEPAFNHDSDVVFKGWTEDPNYVVAQDGIVTANSPILTINQIRTDSTNGISSKLSPAQDGTIVKYYAVLVKSYKVNYIGDAGALLGASEMSFRADAPANREYTVNMPYTPQDAEHDFEGWLVVNGSEHIADYSAGNIYYNDDVITINGDVTFTVNAPKGNWLVFDENGKGGTYNAPKFILSGENTAEPDITTMSRNGYRFGGWYDSKEHADAHGKDESDEAGKFIFGGTISEKTTVYASWIPNTRAPYTVIIWTQNQQRTGYEVKDSYVNTNGVVGQDIPYTSVENMDEDYATITGASSNIGHYTGFCLKEDSKDQHITITPEGDAVLNLYYDRIEYNFKFYIYRDGTQNNRYDYANNSGTGSSLNDLVTWHTNENEHPNVTGYTVQSENVGNRTYYYFVMNAYYGEDLVESGKWPTYDKITGANGRQAVSYVMMVGTKLKPNPTNTGTGTVKGIISVLNENILGATNNANGNYVIVRFPDNSNNWRYHIWYETIDGEDYTGKTTRTYEGKTYYEDDVLVVRSSNTDVNSQNEPKYTGFTFLTKKGQNWNNGNYWTTNEGNTTLYHLNFVYNREQYKVEFFDGNYVDEKNDPIQNHSSNLLHESDLIGQGATIPNDLRNYVPSLPAGETGYVFEGWYLDEGCTTPYTWTTMPVGGITVFAKWRQIQYRVFLHPNVSRDDNSLDWGSDSQAMNFRVSFGGKVSAPTGLRDDYEFVGWYRDEGLTQPFNAEAFVLNEKTVTANYDKTTDMTDPSDKFGSDLATQNSDAERFWITKKLDLYAKWRSKLPGALGITVEYEYKDSTGATKTVQDDKKYVDQAKANAINGFAPPEGKIFDKWQLQTYNDGFVPTDRYVYPGETFEVLKSDAQQVIDEQAEDGTIIAATYTIKLVAIYRDAEQGTPTHIYWYKNDGTAGPIYRDPANYPDTTANLAINEAVAIKKAPSREGYIFKGWGKIEEPRDESNPRAFEEFAPKDVEVKPLVYFKEGTDGAEGKYYKDEACTIEAEFVAADEDGKYEALIALWEGKQDQLTYMPNGGTGTMNPTKGKVGKPVKVADNEFTREGYTFTGWNTKADNSGTAYGIGNSYVLTPGEDILYAQWKINSHNLTINYVYEDGTQAADTYTATPKYNEAYSVKSPTITGYTADKTVVSGTMPDEDVTVTVVYSINSYNLTIKYEYEDGTKAADTYTDRPDYNEAYSVTSPTITGYTADKSVVSGTMPAENVEVTVVYKANDYEYSVEYYYENESGEYDLAKTDKAEATFNTEVSVNPKGTSDYNEHHYVLEKVDPESKTIKIASDSKKNVIKVYYAIDEISDEKDDPEEPDNIPDKYQVIVYYEVKHGKWDDEPKDSEKRTEIVTLVDKDGNWSKDGEAELHAPAVGQSPDDGYLKSGSWDKQPEKATIADKDQDTTYRFTYNIGSFEYSVEYYYENESGEYDLVKTDKESAKFNTEVSVNPKGTSDYNEHHYVLEKVDPESKTIKIASDSKKNVIKVYYAIDEISDEKDDPEEPDNIPDKYQVIVYYEVKHGKWDDEPKDSEKRTEIVTLVDKDGNWSKDGEAELHAPAVGNTPDDGYLKSGSWDKKPEKATIADKDKDTTYRFTYNIGSFEYSVEYYYENESGEYDLAKTDKAEAKFNTEVSVDPKGTSDYNDHHYVLEKVDPESKTIKIASDSKKNVIEVYYALDELNDDPEGPDTPTGGDDIPDKYQIKVYYNVVNGYWDKIEDNKETTDVDESRAKVLDVVTLKKDNKPSTDEDAKGELEVPVVGEKPDEGYCAGEWDKEVPKTVTKSADKTEYTYTYEIDNLNDDPEGPDTPTGGDDIPDKYQIKVYYNVVNGYWDEIEDNKETTDVDESRAKVLDVVTLKKDNKPSTDEDAKGELEVPVVGEKPDKGYCAGEWDKEVPKTVTKSADKTEYTYTYEIDNLNDDPEGPDTPTGGDDIPDKYQIKVYYNVVNGAWDKIEDNKETTDVDESRAKVLDVVTLKKDNKPSTDEDAEGELEVPVVGGKPDEGYCAGEWDKEVPKTVTKSADKTEYTYTYETDNLNDDPEGPDTPTGGDGIPDKYQITVSYEVEHGAWDEITDNEETTDKDESISPVLDVVTLKDKEGKPSEAEDAEGELEVPAVGSKPDVGYWTGDWKTTPPETVTRADKDSVYVYEYIICKPVEHDPPVKKIIYGDADNTSDVFKFTLTAISNDAGAEMPMPEGSNGNSKTVQIKGAGEYEFGIIKFTMPGTYKYRIVEEKESNANYEYDNSVYDLTYEVYQEEDQLYCDRTMLRNGEEQVDEEIYFMNKYTAPVEADEYENPRTGDNIYVYVIMLVISSLGIVASIMDDKKRKQEEAK